MVPLPGGDFSREPIRGERSGLTHTGLPPAGSGVSAGRGWIGLPLGLGSSGGVSVEGAGNPLVLFDPFPLLLDPPRPEADDHQNRGKNENRPHDRRERWHRKTVSEARSPSRAASARLGARAESSADRTLCRAASANPGSTGGSGVSEKDSPPAPSFSWRSSRLGRMRRPRARPAGVRRPRGRREWRRAIPPARRVRWRRRR